MILRTLIRTSLTPFAARRAALVALTTCAAMLGCSEEAKFEPRRTSRISRSAPRREAPPPTTLAAFDAASPEAKQHAPEPIEAQPRQCAPDAVLTAGETAVAQSSTADRSIVTLSELETQAMPTSAPQAAPAGYAPTYDELSPGDAAALIKQAEEHNRRGLTFAAKGAIFSARKEFHAALRATAGSLDAAERSTRHRAALTSGLAALTEMNDFNTGEADVATTVAGHASQLVTSEAAAVMSPASLRERYGAAAVEQLTFAAASPTGSVALHRLGKAMLVGTPNSKLEDRTKARALLEAALRVDANNFPAANDLAVELAHDGYFDRAVSLLRDGLSRSPQPALWMNLASIHDLRGEGQLAQAARLEARHLAIRNPAGVVPTHNVAWVDARMFAAASQPNTEMQNAPKLPANAAAKPTATNSPSAVSALSQAAVPTPSAAARQPISTASAPRRNAMVQ